MKPASITDVAKASGFGVGTVSRVLSGDKSVKDSTRAKIMKTIEELHYVRNINGARLRKKHSGVIAVMVPVINHPFFAEFVEEVEKVADKAGCSLLLITSQMNEQKEKEVLLKIRQREIDGGIFVTHYEHDQADLEGCPLVSIDRHLAGNVPLVTSDNYESTKRALEILYSHGARRIGFVGTSPTVESEVSLRKKAYDDFIAEKGLTPRAKYEAINHGEEKALAESFLDLFPDVDAVFASNTAVATAFYALALQRGVDIPGQVELISYDGVSEAWGGKAIDCVRQNVKAMAEVSFALLQDLIEGRDVQPVSVVPTTALLGHTTKTN